MERPMRKILLTTAAAAVVIAAATAGLAAAPGQITIKGATGYATCAEPVRSTVFKEAYCLLQGYSAPAGAAQRYAFPTPFLHEPFVVGTVLASASDASGIALPVGAEPMTGWIFMEGF